jgi:hypothetical protein
VDNVCVREGSHYVENTVGSHDVGQESISKSCSLTSSLNESSNIINGNLCGNILSRLVRLN